MSSDPFIVPSSAASWMEESNGGLFSIQNLPLCSCQTRDKRKFLAVRIGNFILDLARLADSGLLPFLDCVYAQTADSLSVSDFRRIRESAFHLLEDRPSRLRDDESLRKQCVVPLTEVSLQLPTLIPSFTDFYSGIHHASNVGKMFRPEMPPLFPNYKSLPVAYNGRASSVTVSPNRVYRPFGQFRDPEDGEPRYEPTRELDLELEIGFFVARPEEPLERITVANAESHILGVCLVNDWSARDIQRWENQPLGPFLSKSFLTGISPYVVSLDALSVFRTSGSLQDPPPLAYLRSTAAGLYNLDLTIAIKSDAMGDFQTVSKTNAKHLYWSFAQQLAHLTSNGLTCVPGELCASGTISGETLDSLGSLLEISWRGTRPLVLKETGEHRTFLRDGDTVRISGQATNRDYKIGLGDIIGHIVGVANL